MRPKTRIAPTLVLPTRPFKISDRLPPHRTIGGSAASRAIAAAEAAVEADKILSKKQRVAALKALDAARYAIGVERKAKERAGRNGKAGARKKASARYERAAEKPGAAPTPVRYRVVPSTKAKAKAKPAKTYRWVTPKVEVKTRILPSVGGTRYDLYFDGNAPKTVRWETAPAKKGVERRIYVVTPSSGEAAPVTKKHQLRLRGGDQAIHYVLSAPKTDSKKRAASKKGKRTKRPAKIHI